VAAAVLLSCGSGPTGFLYVVNQGSNPGAVTTFAFSLSNGSLQVANDVLNPVGQPAPTGAQPTVVIFNPAQTVAYVANTASSDLSSYTVNHDGSLAPISGTTSIVGKNTPAARPVALATDLGGHFLFVANQGSPSSAPPIPGNVAVLAIGTGGNLSPIACPPATPDCWLVPVPVPAGASYLPTPSALTVSNQGNFLYVTDAANGTVVGYPFDPSSGTLHSPLASTPVTVGTTPSGVFSPPTTGTTFLYVTNSGSGNIYGFQVGSDGTLLPNATLITSVGIAPVAMLSDPQARYLYVLDNVSNLVFEFRINAVTGLLTPLSPPSASTGANPVSFTLRSDGTVNGNFWLFTSNFTANTVSTFLLTSTTGVLSPLPQQITPQAPYGIASR
jgi:6-phosphogluconolactonase (cycloisomerase 2 family)